MRKPRIHKITAYEMHEVRMWISTIVLPIAALWVYSDPAAAQKLTSARVSIQNKISQLFNKKV